LFGNAELNIPIFRRLKTNAVNVAQHAGLFYGTASWGYFIFEEAVLKNTPNSAGIFIDRLYFESTEIIVDDGTSIVGVDVHRAISVINCSFKGCSTGIEQMSGIGGLFVCRSTFENCRRCVRVAPDEAEIVKSFFSNYTEVAVYFMSSLETPLVRGCAFSSSADVLAIKFVGGLSLSESCFGSTGIAIEGMSAWMFTLGPGCCFRADNQSAAISCWEIDNEKAGNPYGCIWQCDLAWVTQDGEACVSDGYPPRPTHRATETPIIPVGAAPPTASPVPMGSPSYLFEETKSFGGVGGHPSRPPSLRRRERAQS
jgi:hypothetical protein